MYDARMATPSVLQKFNQRFGPITEPLEWFGVNEYGIGDALKSVDHVIERNGIFSTLEGEGPAAIASAYLTARLVHGKLVSVVPHEFGMDGTEFGIVGAIGSITAVDNLLGKTFADGAVEDRDNRVMKAQFVSPCGLAATVRQAARARERVNRVVNRAGMAELAIAELLPEAQAIVVAQVAGVSDKVG